MGRRTFVRCVSVFVAGMLSLELLPVSEPLTIPERKFLRFVRDADQWVPVRFEDIRAGMEIWVYDGPGNPGEVLKVSGDYDPATEVFWFTHRINPETNQWVTA